jgi:recombination associated protein RdgC
MGLIQGSLSYRMFYVEGDVPGNFKASFIEAIRLNMFRPLLPQAEEDISSGWVSIFNLLDTAFEPWTVFNNQFVFLGFRIDRWVIPPALLKAKVKQAEQEYRDSQKREHLTRLESQEITQLIRSQMKQKAIPGVRAFDFYWELDRKQVCFGSTSRTVSEAFVDLFERTFELHLVPDSPYMRALSVGLGDDLIGHLAEVEPATFVERSHGSD